MDVMTYNILSFVLIMGVVLGIKLMNSPKTAVKGNAIGAISMLGAIALTLIRYDILGKEILYISIAIGAAIGYFFAVKISMIQMPQLVALFNGFGGGASAFVALVSFLNLTNMDVFNKFTGSLALIVGGITLSGSLVAAGKLARVLPQKPVFLKGHSAISAVLLLAMAVLTVLTTTLTSSVVVPLFILTLFVSLVFGIIFTVRVGGADMPVTISLLNSFSGVASSLAGFVVNDPLLVAVGGIVGAAGLILTQIMCKAMNRSLMQILTGKTSVSPQKAVSAKKPVEKKEAEKTFVQEEIQEENAGTILNNAKTVVIVPGYGMALAQAQHKVKALAEKLEGQGKDVKFAIHPVAGRMPGHMNVLLAEADVSYDKLYELETINPDFKETDVVIVVGANDVVNPAAITAEDTPIYGMPILRVDEAKHVIMCNFDTKPGYAGVDNPLYTREEDVTLLLGDAADTITELEAQLDNAGKLKTLVQEIQEENAGTILNDAKTVVIVPGYGMALAQAQHKVKALAEKLEAQGKDVKFAIHPVAGRMPGHMNVLLAEADVSYDKLYELETINPDFKETDVVIVVGANDVVNPAAITAEDTPIYGMPILRVDEAKHVIMCNFDTKPGYAGVDNPLYTREENVTLLLGDAADTITELEAQLDNAGKLKTLVQEEQEENAGTILNDAKTVVIVPGYGMALAQAQHKVKALAEKLESQGKDVKFAIHPVAGRMPGHMNVLLAEADVSYDKLYELEAINPDFKETDVVIVVGANDVVNPAAITAEDTPIYGMPILRVDEAKHVIMCNFDTKPGYAGVDNPLYTREEDVTLLLGDAADTITELEAQLDNAGKLKELTPSDQEENVGTILNDAKTVVIVPGYGMALAQAQHKVKALAEKLESQGKDVKFAIHPVAGRMPGHMNVLLAEADVPYDKLYELEAINPEFKETDVAIVVGANDVVNPAAITAEDTPIYGMPILRVDEAKHVIMCNFDTKPGYAGVDNPLYTREENVTLLLGDAADTITELEAQLDNAGKLEVGKTKKEDQNIGTILNNAKSVIIVPGYGMALAQAQHKVKALAEKLESQGKDVKFAIHPVAGRMPGHMNVLLAEADVSYDKLYELEAINPKFKETDVAIVVGANDVVNPAAITAEDTPIYGMPILRVDEAKHVIMCNFDTKPGYAGVDNPLYAREENVTLLLGDAADTIKELDAICL